MKKASNRDGRRLWCRVSGRGEPAEEVQRVRSGGAGLVMVGGRRRSFSEAFLLAVGEWNRTVAARLASRENPCRVRETPLGLILEGRDQPQVHSGDPPGQHPGVLGAPHHPDPATSHETTRSFQPAKTAQIPTDVDTASPRTPSMSDRGRPIRVSRVCICLCNPPVHSHVHGRTWSVPPDASRSSAVVPPDLRVPGCQRVSVHRPTTDESPLPPCRHQVRSRLLPLLPRSSTTQCGAEALSMSHETSPSEPNAGLTQLLLGEIRAGLTGTRSRMSTCSLPVSVMSWKLHIRLPSDIRAARSTARTTR